MSRFFEAVSILAILTSQSACTEFKTYRAPTDGPDAGADAAGNGECPSGTRDCGGVCQSDTDVNFCGATCEHCTAPQNGAAICNGSCGVKCNANFNLCGTSCKASTDPTACGPTCIRCDAPVGGSAACDGTKCGPPTCPAGQKICNGACIDAARSCDGVCSNGKYNCPDGVCRDTNAVTSCGTACQPCPAKANATATSCNGGTCGYTCNSGYLQCGDGSCSRATWDYETGDLQGSYGVGQTPASAEAISVRSDRVHGGSYSAGGRLLQGDSSYFLEVVFPVCESQPTDMNGKRFTGWVYSPHTAYQCLMAVRTDGGISSVCTVNDPGWKYLEADLSGVAASTKVQIMGPGDWNGRVYVDDFEIR